MNAALSFKTLAVLALVAISTASIVALPAQAAEPTACVAVAAFALL
ncbi:hypothetical protein [Rugamonas sp.]|nr:hypothetical protein [Rugamonas sp.]